MKEEVVTRYFRILEHSITHNHSLEKYIQTKMYKTKLEEYLLDQDMGHPDVPRLQAKILDAKEAHLIEEFLPSNKNFKNIINTLEKLKVSGHFSQASMFLDIFSFLENKNLLNSLHHLAKKQAHALKHNKYNSFLKAYNKEKILLYELMSHLSHLNIQDAINEVVRTEKQPKMNKSSFPVSTQVIGVAAITAIICFGLFSDDISAITSLKSWLGALGTSAFFGDVVFMNKVFDTKRITHKMRLYNESNKLHDDVMELIAHIEKFYGVKIKGRMTFDELSDFEELLEMYHPAELRKFLRAAFFRPSDKTTVQMVQHDGEQLGRYHAVYDRGSLSLDIYVMDKHNMFHELTHAKIFSLPSMIYNAWDAINEEGVTRSQLAKKVEVVPGLGQVIGWKELKHQPAFGYARSYSVTNVDEDLASMADFVFDVSEGTHFPVHDVEYFVPYRHIYEKKSELLVRFGIISKIRQEKFIKWLHSFKETKIKTHPK